MEAATTRVPAGRPSGPSVARFRVWGWVMCLVTLLGVCGYIVHVRSPLRLNTDAVIILTSAHNYNEGRGFSVDGTRPVYPLPALHAFAAIERWGVGTSAGYTTINLVSLAVGLMAWGWVLRRSWRFATGPSAGLEWLTMAVWVLLSFTLIKHLSIPLTDVPFFALAGLAMVAITSIGMAPRMGLRVLLLLVGVGLTAMAIGFRTVGICLLPPLALAFFRLLPEGGASDALRLRWKASTAVALLGLVAIGTFVAIRTPYWTQMWARYADSTLTEVFDKTLVQRLVEMGQLFSNVPPSLATGRLSVVMVGLGVAFVGVLVLGRLRFLRRGPGGFAALEPLDAFVVSYMGIMLLWPYEADTRFWIPLLPIFGACVSVCALHALGGRPGCWVVCLLAVGYVGLGLAALGSSSRLSLSGTDFADRYGTPLVQASYRSAWGLPTREGLPEADPKYVAVIQRVDGRR